MLFRSRAQALDLLHHLEACAAGQVHVEHEDVPGFLSDEKPNLGPSARLGHGRDAGSVPQDCSEADADDGVIVGDEDPDHEMPRFTRRIGLTTPRRFLLGFLAGAIGPSQSAFPTPGRGCHQKFLGNAIAGGENSRNDAQFANRVSVNHL